jgi:hypothetical protein
MGAVIVLKETLVKKNVVMIAMEILMGMPIGMIVMIVLEEIQD